MLITCNGDHEHCHGWDRCKGTLWPKRNWGWMLDLLSFQTNGTTVSFMLHLFFVKIFRFIKHKFSSCFPWTRTNTKCIFSPKCLFCLHTNLFSELSPKRNGPFPWLQWQCQSANEESPQCFPVSESACCIFNHSGICGFRLEVAAQTLTWQSQVVSDTKTSIE